MGVIWQTAQMDPPWKEQGAGKIKRGADRHYPLIATKDMSGVIRDSGLWTPAENAHLYMWVTNTFLPDGLWLMKELGFTYKTNVCWTKKQMGIGRYFRGKHELLLFGTRGRGWAVRTDRNDIAGAYETEEDEDYESYFNDGSSIEADHVRLNGKRKHSGKPEIFTDMIESRSKGPYVEFFARSLRPNWTSWGNDEAVQPEVTSTEPTVVASEPMPAVPVVEPSTVPPSPRNGWQVHPDNSAWCYHPITRQTEQTALLLARQQTPRTRDPIVSFTRTWLSNFWPCAVSLEGEWYASVEHAYQAAKTAPEHRAVFQDSKTTAAQAKDQGKKVPLRSDWSLVQLPVMYQLLRQKYALGTPLATQLLETVGQDLVEGNSWGDVFWGVCHGKGANWLGVLTMEIRDSLQKELELQQSSVTIANFTGDPS